MAGAARGRTGLTLWRCRAGMAVMKMWSTDVRDLAPMGTAPEAVAAERRAHFTQQVVEAATSRPTHESWCSAVRCIARAGRKACRGRVQVVRPEPERVEWLCLVCGESGVVTGFAGTEFDMSPYVPRAKKLRLWGFDEESRDVLLAGTMGVPSLRAIIARASPAVDVPDLLILQATVDELDEVYTLVEHLTAVTRSRRRIELLDGLRFGLSTAMDGF